MCNHTSKIKPTSISDVQHVVVLVDLDLDGKLLCSTECSLVSQGEESNLVEGIRGIGYQLTKEDLHRGGSCDDHVSRILRGDIEGREGEKEIEMEIGKEGGGGERHCRMGRKKMRRKKGGVRRRRRRERERREH